jgi:hypothetical protein
MASLPINDVTLTLPRGNPLRQIKFGQCGARLNRIVIVRQCASRYKVAEAGGRISGMGAVGAFRDGYTPSEDETFMNERQRDYFRRK